MNIQESFIKEQPSVYLVATPIGNLSEMTPRAIEILNMVDVIACEDTRVSRKLLDYFGIKKRLLAYHNFNEEASSEGLLKLLREGLSIALLSDAGYPLLCDPGTTLVQKVLAENFNLIPISGSNAMLNALVASGLSIHPFFFFGFLPANDNQRKIVLREHQSLPYTLIYYESPHRIQKTIQDLYEILGNRNVCIAREITKKFETFIRGSLLELQQLPALKGEIVIVVEGNKIEENKAEDYIIELQQLIDNGEKTSSAVKQIAKKYNVSKNRLYELIHK